MVRYVVLCIFRQKLCGPVAYLGKLRIISILKHGWYIRGSHALYGELRDSTRNGSTRPHTSASLFVFSLIISNRHHYKRRLISTPTVRTLRKQTETKNASFWHCSLEINDALCEKVSRFILLNPDHTKSAFFHISTDRFTFIKFNSIYFI